jgi:hypothetical protein
MAFIFLNAMVLPLDQRRAPSFLIASRSSAKGSAALRPFFPSCGFSLVPSSRSPLETLALPCGLAVGLCRLVFV